MGHWYTSREAVKNAAGIEGSAANAIVDLAIEAASRRIDGDCRQWFIPITETRKYDARHPTLRGRFLTLDAPLISISAFTDQGDEAVAVASTEYRLLSENHGVPYHTLELLLDVTDSAFAADPDTHQQSLRITGLWGAANDTISAGDVGSNQDGSETTLVVTDGSSVEVGDSLLIGSEQELVTNRTDADLGINTNGSTGAMDADKTDKTLTLASAPTDPVKVGEVLRIGSERMLVEAINTTTSFEVERAHDGTTLAAHSTGDDVFIFRTFTVERNANGSTVATHSDGATITRYRAPIEIANYCLALAVSEFHQARAGYGRTIGVSEGQQEFRGTYLKSLRDLAINPHRRYLLASF
mgnify:CR=1 FL=1